MTLKWGPELRPCLMSQEGGVQFQALFWAPILAPRLLVFCTSICATIWASFGWAAAQRQKVFLARSEHGCARGCLCDSLKCVLGQAQLSLTQPENLQPWRHLRTQPVSGRDFGTLKQGPCMRAVFKVFRDRMSLRTIFSLRQ